MAFIRFPLKEKSKSELVCMLPRPLSIEEVARSKSDKPDKTP